MALKDDYLQVAKRALKASNDTRKVQEKSAFLSYHAFESAGCALSDHAGLNVGPSVSHNLKVQRFNQSAATYCDSSTQTKISSTAVLLHNLRNKLLYPSLVGSSGTYSRPESILTQSQSNSLRNEVKLITDEVEKII